MESVPIIPWKLCPRCRGISAHHRVEFAVLAGEANTSLKSGDGNVEMIRHLKIARDTALKARTQAMVTLKTLIVNAPQPLREAFIAVTGPMTLIRALAALRPGPMTSTTASAKTALRMLARRWLTLAAEIRELDDALERLVRRQASALMAAPGIADQPPRGSPAKILVDPGGSWS